MTRSRADEFSPKTKAARFLHAAGRCEGCGVKLRPGNIEYDHEIPVALGGDNSIDNCRCLCRNCHGAKTSGHDVPAIAKAKRRQRAHIGAKKPSKFRAARSGDLKIKIDGTVVDRRTGEIVER